MAYQISALKLVLLLSLFPFSISISFNYSRFNQTSQGIQYQGHASFSNDSIHLTSTDPNSFGRAVYYQSVPVWDSVSSDTVTDFTTSFTFIVDGSNGSDGLAFFLAPYPSIVPAKSYGTYLALFNGTLDTIQPEKIIAVEFDSSGVSESGNQNLVKSATGINNFSVTTVSLNSSVTQGVTAMAVINYKYTTRNFSVSVSYPAGTIGKQNWSVSHICDLKETLPSDVAIGFSSSMSNNNNNQPHRILSWNFASTLEKSISTENKKNKLALGLGLGFSIGIPMIALMGFLFYIRKIRKNKRGRYSMAIEETISALNQGAGPRRFTYTQLITATKNFSEDRKLGAGGSGEVYRGILTNPNYLEIAVKRISGSEKGKKEYISEVTIISRIRHRNLVQLIGFCHERGDLLLVYEFMSNGSLDTHLYNNNHVLGSSERFKIISGLASALLYLHEECEQCVVHRDIKPSNVMLDSEFNPKLGDFGLARLMDHDNESLTTRLAGTFGYIAPEYGSSGKASRETDIFSFGVVTLEILCGRKPIKRTQEQEEADLIQWVWDNYGASTTLTVIDKRLNMDFVESKMERMIGVGLWCAHPDCTQRPTIRQVINVLNLDAPLPELPARMPVPTYRQPFSNNESSSSQNPSTGEVFSYSDISNSAVLGR